MILSFARLKLVIVLILVSLLIFSGIVLYYYFILPNNILLNSTVTMSSGCKVGCSDVIVQINSNASIQDINVGLMQASASCFQSNLICDPAANCSLPSGFCFKINTASDTDTIKFQGVEQGYYWLDFNAALGNNESTGQFNGLHVINQTTYYVSANMTSKLATFQIGISNSSAT